MLILLLIIWILCGIISWGIITAINIRYFYISNGIIFDLFLTFFFSLLNIIGLFAVLIVVIPSGAYSGLKFIYKYDTIGKRQWFAWYPVKIDKGKWVWFKNIVMVVNDEHDIFYYEPLAYIKNRLIGEI